MQVTMHDEIQVGDRVVIPANSTWTDGTLGDLHHDEERVGKVNDIMYDGDALVETDDGHAGYVAVDQLRREGEEPEVDLVNHPPHYKFSNGAEVIDLTENLSFNGGNAVKYLARATRQDGKVKGNVLEDLEKAKFYVEREIGRLTNAE